MQVLNTKPYKTVLKEIWNKQAGNTGKFFYYSLEAEFLLLPET